MRDLPDDFQIEQLHASLQFVKDFRLAIDIGAHRGIWTKILCDRFQRVIAIEPTELVEMIDERALKVRAACGARTGKCRMQQGKRNTGQTYVMPGGNTPIITIDSLEVDPSFIKIDVEGMEPDVLKGARRTIQTHRPVVMIEENGLCERYGHSIGRASRILRAWGASRVATFHMPPEKDENRLFKFL